MVGATSVIRRVKADALASPWVRALLERRPARVVTVAMAKQDRPYCLGGSNPGRGLSTCPPLV